MIYVKRLSILAVIILWIPFFAVGILLNYAAKLLNIIGYILTLNFRTAIDEMTWKFTINIVDSTDRFHWLRKAKRNG